MNKSPIQSLPSCIRKGLLLRHHIKIMCLVLCCFFSLSLLAQNEKLSVDFNKITLKKALGELHEKSGYNFIYNSKLIDDSRVVSLRKTNADLPVILNELFAGTDIRYNVDDKQVVLYNKNISEGTSEIIDTNNPPSNVGGSNNQPKPTTNLQQKNTIIRGTVKDENGLPLPGAVVSVKGNTKNTTTDVNGKFEFISIEPNTILVISFLGYETREVLFNGNADISVQMKPAETLLDAAVIVGYGATTTRVNTSAISSVTGKVISEQPVSDPLGALQGRVSGMFISSSNGLPGSSYSIQIRGINSIAAGNEPLFIVNGVPFISEPLNQFSGANGNQSPLNSINPTDIERIDILKDADATAIYGSRGANGVVLITTKTGKVGKTKFDFNVYTGISQVGHRLAMLNPSQYYDLRNDAFVNDGVTPDNTNAPDLVTWDKSKTTDWQDYLIGGTANLTEAQMAISGGNDQTSYMLSGTYRYENTVFPGDMSYDRGTVLLNLNHRSKDNKFNLTASANYSVDNNNTAPVDLTSYYNLPPNLPLYNPDGSLYWYGNTLNPVAFLSQTYNTKTNSLIGNTSLSYMILTGLEAKISLGYTNMAMNQIRIYPEKSLNPVNNPESFADYGFSKSNSYIAEPQINYTISLWKGKLSVLLGGTWQQSITQGHYLEGTGYSDDALLKDMQSATTVTVKNASYSQYNYESLFARVNYNWQEKYLINATFRRDGSSRFAPGKRFGNFGAIGAAWIFTNERFMAEALPFMSFGKLRSSYGVTGNDQIPNYGYLDSWESTSFPYDNVSGLAPARLYNNNYSWEENRKFEVGLELGFFNSRVFLKADYYLNRSDNQLIGFSLSPQTGFDEYIANLPALVENTGWEFDLNANIIQSSYFTWDAGLNFTLSKNKLLEYPDLESSSYADTYVIGEPIDIEKGFNFMGVDKQTGIAQFQDINEDGDLSSPEDYIILGSRMPKFYGGLSNNLRYKNLSLNFLFQFVGQDGPSINYGYMAYPNGTMSNSTTEVLNRWRQAGDNTDVPKASRTSGNIAYNTYNSYYRFSNAVWGDASYIRLKNLRLTYDLSNWAQRFKMSGLSVYIQMQNVFTLTNYIGFDPETQGLSLPPLRTITAGIRLSL